MKSKVLETNATIGGLIDRRPGDLKPWPRLAGWDATLLKDELELLIAEDFDIETTGFSIAEIDILFDGAEEPSGSDPDDLQLDDIAAEVVSRVGDLWRLGTHSLICGELDPQYVDVGVMRWQRVTGKKAILEATGQNWDQVRASRLSGADMEGGHGL